MDDVLEKEASKRLDREWKNLSNESKNRIRKMRIFDGNSHKKILGKPRNRQKDIPQVGLLDRITHADKIGDSAQKIRDKNNVLFVESKYPAGNFSMGYIRDNFSALRKGGYSFVPALWQAIDARKSEAHSFDAKNENSPIINVVSNNNARDTAINSNNPDTRSILYGKTSAQRHKYQDRASKNGILHEAFESIKKRKPARGDEMMVRATRNPYNKKKNKHLEETIGDITNAYAVSTHKDVSVPILESRMISQLHDSDPVKKHHMGMREETGEIKQYKKYGFNYGEDAGVSPSKMKKIRDSVKKEKLNQGYVPVPMNTFMDRVRAQAMISDRNANEKKMKKQDAKMLNKGFLL